MRKHATLYLDELAWRLPSVALPAGMLAALAVTAFGAHIGLPGEAGRVEPAAVLQTVPFNQPGVVEVAPGRYEAHLVAGIWFFTQPEIRVPEGSEVTFVATSKDVIHALLYFLNMLLTCVASHAPAPETPALAEALSGPEEGPVILDRWRPWLILTAVLLVLAYGHPLIHLVSNAPMNVPGMRVW